MLYGVVSCGVGLFCVTLCRVACLFVVCVLLSSWLCLCLCCACVVLF